MPSSAVVVAGRRYLLPRIGKMGKAKLLHLFPNLEAKRPILIAYVARKLGPLRKA